jgi:hypothetical protein
VLQQVSTEIYHIYNVGEVKFIDAGAEVMRWMDRERRDPWQLPKV